MLDENSNENDQQKAEAAATTIQATFRGYKIRKQYSKSTDSKFNPRSISSDQIDTSKLNNKNKSQEFNSNKDSEEQRQILVTTDDFNLNNTDPEKAAVRIQATYRGFRARKELQSNNKKGILTSQN